MRLGSVQRAGNAFLPLASRGRARATLGAAQGLFRHFVLPSPTLPLLRETFRWAREAGPTQPLTAAVWAPNRRLNRLQLDASDIITFHQYAGPEKLRSRIAELKAAHRRPVLCTEYLARKLRSRFETHLPIFREHRVGAYNWGLVSGKTQTIHHWEDPPGSPEPEVWHHDVLRADGTPYDAEEARVLRRFLREEAADPTA